MTNVRVVFALHARPGRTPDGRDVPDPRLSQHLIVLADDTGHRAVPLWIRVADAKVTRHLLDRPAGDTAMTGGLQETAVRLLDAGGSAVTGVDIEPASADARELCWDTVTTRAEVAAATGTRHVPVGVAYGLALAAVAGAPVRVADEVLDRLAVPVQGEDVLAPFRPDAGRPLESPGKPGAAKLRRRFEPRNMAFTDGLDYWELVGKAVPPHGQDYSCTTADQTAALVATVPEPEDPANLVQTVYADDYRGRTVTFRGRLRATDLAGRAGLHLFAGRPGETPRDGRLESSLADTGSTGWTWHEVTTPVPGDASVVRFGISLLGRGRIELRDAELTQAGPGTQESRPDTQE